MDKHTQKERARARLQARQTNMPKQGTRLPLLPILAIILVLILAFFLGSTIRSCSNSVQNEPTANTAPVSSTTSSTSTASTTSSSSNTNTTANTSTASSSDSSQQSSAGLSAVQKQGIVASIVASAQQHADELEVLGDPDFKVSDILDEYFVDKMMELAKTNDEVKWISNHAGAYMSDGWEVQYKILKLASEEPAASTYVRNWPTEYPAETQNTSHKNAIKTKTTGPNNVPQLFQWDPRWGYTVYSSTSFGLTGCCPTTLAMVYQGLTGKTDMTPYDMGQLAARDGYMALYDGTDSSFLSNEAWDLGLNCIDVWSDSSSIVAALESNLVLIANVGPGDFTNDGHFIVLSGLKDGKIIVNDPYSKERSEKLWDPETISMQSMIIFGFSKR